MTSHYIGQGKGVEGRYAGLPDSFCNPNSEIVIVPIPFDKTSTYQHGSEKGPEALIEASRNMELYDIETASEVYKKGIYTDTPVLASASDEMVDLSYKRVKQWLEQNKFVVTIGGEHSISYGPIRAHAERFAPMTVLQIDAHADLQQLYEGNPLSHACVMARVKEIPNVTKIVAVGIRSMSSEELSSLSHTDTIFAHEIYGSDDWIDRAIDAIEGPVYLTFDLDAFDSSLMPSTGTPEPGGLFWEQTMRFMRRVIERKILVGFDVVELLPSAHNIAPDYLASKLIYKILSYQYGKKRK